MTPEKSQVETHAAESCLQAQPGSLEQLSAFAQGGYLFAILDATDCPAVPVKAQELGQDRAISLFRGTAEENYWEVAPYLMKVDPELLEWIKQSRWSEPWGIFAMAKCGLDELRRHFRRFLLVKLPDGKTWYFRYYDPRVLKPFLEACHTDELVRLFGPVCGFATAGPIPNAIEMLSPSAPEKKPKHALQVTSDDGSVDPLDAPRQAFPFVIRGDHYGAVADVQLRSFVLRCKQYFEEQSIEVKGGVEKFVRRGVRHAGSVGITSETDVIRFLQFFAAPPHAASDEMVRTLFSDESLTGTQKVNLLCELAAFDEEGA